jgi:hypothetical protein
MTCDLYTKILSAWDETNTDQYVGKIWSFATDGDSTRRAAGYKMFVKEPLPPSSQIYWLLHDMHGLNLQTGQNEITLDFDFKHVFKHEWAA